MIGYRRCVRVRMARYCRHQIPIAPFRAHSPRAGFPLSPRCALHPQDAPTQQASQAAADPPATTVDPDKLDTELFGESTAVGTPAAAETQTMAAAESKPASSDSGYARAMEREIQREYDDAMAGLAAETDPAEDASSALDHMPLSALDKDDAQAPEARVTTDQGGAHAADASAVPAAEVAPPASSAEVRADAATLVDLDIHLEDAAMDDAEIERTVDELSDEEEELKDSPDDIAPAPPSNSELLEEVHRLQGEGRHSAAIVVLTRAVEQASALIAALGPDPSLQVSDKETNEARANATATLLEAHGFLGEIYLVCASVGALLWANARACVPFMCR
jgi:hypothetical protein